MRKNRTKKLIKSVSILITMLILVFCVNVSAEMFSAGEPAAFSDEFTSGEAGNLTGDGTNLIIPGDGIMSESPMPPVSDSENSYIEGDSSVQEENTAGGEGSESETLPEGDMENSEDMEKPEEALEDNVAIMFYSRTGTEYTELQMQVKMGDTIVLPIVPGRENAAGNGWKAEPDMADEMVTKWEAGSSLTVSNTDFYLSDKIQDGVLKLYAVPGTDPCIVTYYTADGSAILNQVEVKSGTELMFPDFELSGFRTEGWSEMANASAPTWLVGDRCTITSDQKFYIVRTKLAKATFKSRKGKTSTVLDSYAQTVEKGTTIIMPAVPEVLGYQSLGWALETYAEKAKYKAGETVVLKKNTTFYAAYKYVGKKTVKFTNNRGTTTSTSYSSLTRTVTKNTYIVLPELPASSGYVNIGWTTVKEGSAAQYEPGDKIKVTKNMTLYAVRKKAYKVYLRQKDGTLWKTVEVAKNSYYKLPGKKNPNGYTMMGWSTKKGQSVKPKYQVGEKLKITKNTTLYMVMFARSGEKNFSGNDLQEHTAGLLNKYRKVIFVGDSRMVRLQDTLKVAGYSASSDNISFVAASGQGLNWLKSTGYQELLNRVGNGASSKAKPIAVIFNLGVNDMGNIDKYVTYMKSIAPELEKRGCKLFYMSVNPVNNEILKSDGVKKRPEETLRSFNAAIKSKLCGKKDAYKYIDSYSFLMKNGFGTNAGQFGHDAEHDDGLHYTVKTSKRIFWYAINYLKK